MSENENVQHTIDFHGNAESLRWVQRAQAGPKDGRPVLQGVYVNGAIMAVDGFRLHAAPTPEPLQDEAVQGKILDFGKPVAAKAEIVKATEIDGSYPEMCQVFPKGDPSAEILINPRLLADALSGMQGAARIAVRPGVSPIEVFGKDKNGEPLYALIMPLNPDHTDTQTLTWRPNTKTEEM